MTQVPTFNRSLLHPRYWLTWVGIGLLYLLVLLPYPVIYWLGTSIGRFSMRFLKRRVAIAQRNLELCFPDMPQAERDALRPRTAPPPPNYAHTQECVRSRRLMQEAADAQAREPLVYNPRLEAAQRQMDLDCLGPEGYAEMEKARAQRPQVVVVPVGRPVHTAPPQRPKLTHCTDFTCFDTQGKGYPRAGPGRLPGPDGTCRSAGGRAPC